ncbi:MAG: cbb3-type cytochrome c oxidase subunit 3 [Nitrospirae bacterium]|nr:cbb3-type cytochrome c oxidase subunit 3 [Nitrospirota bacterium]
MQWSGWINFGITVVLFIILIMIVAHYYRPRKKSDVERFEKPKYKMLSDDDEDKGDGGRAAK